MVEDKLCDRSSHHICTATPYCQLEARTHTWTVGDDNSNHTLRDLFWVVLEKWRGTKVRWRWHFSAFTVSLSLSLSDFHFLTFPFTLLLSHNRRWDFPFQTFTQTKVKRRRSKPCILVRDFSAFPLTGLVVFKTTRGSTGPHFKLRGFLCFG